jgi:predicted metalloprotease
MRWRDGRRSSNIEDRRGQRAAPKLLGGIGTIAVILVAMYFGVDPTPLLEGMQSGGQASSSGTRPSAEDLKDDPLADRVSVVVADTEDVWTEIFAAQGRRYAAPTLVMFTGATRSACGLGQAAMGPFYCPADKKAYIDLGFYEQMRTRFDAPGDFAQAYVIAHEIGHHVQNLLGISGQVHAMKQQLRIGRTEPEIFSSPVMWKRRLTRRVRSAMTHCKSKVVALWCPSRLPMEPQRSGKNGFVRDCSLETRTNATRFPDDRYHSKNSRRSK